MPVASVTGRSRVRQPPRRRCWRRTSPATGVPSSARQRTTSATSRSSTTRDGPVSVSRAARRTSSTWTSAVTVGGVVASPAYDARTTLSSRTGPIRSTVPARPAASVTRDASGCQAPPTRRSTRTLTPATGTPPGSVSSTPIGASSPDRAVPASTTRPTDARASGAGTAEAGTTGPSSRAASSATTRVGMTRTGASTGVGGGHRASPGQPIGAGPTRAWPLCQQTARSQSSPRSSRSSASSWRA